MNNSFNLEFQPQNSGLASAVVACDRAAYKTSISQKNIMLLTVPTVLGYWQVYKMIMFTELDHVCIYNIIYIELKNQIKSQPTQIIEI